jgi:hypothetical protein
MYYILASKGKKEPYFCTSLLGFRPFTAPNAAPVPLFTNVKIVENSPPESVFLEEVA